MNRKILALLVIAVALVGISMNAAAEEPNCGNITWNAAALELLPGAPSYCQEVVNRDGAWYAKMHARVVRQNPASTTVRFQNADGTWSDSERVHPPRGMKAEVDNHEVRVSELGQGQEINVYALSDEYFAVPDQMAAAEETSAPAPMEEAEEAAPEPEPAPAMLPKTAGNANWLAVLGTLLVLLSGVLYLRRQF